MTARATSAHTTPSFGPLVSEDPCRHTEIINLKVYISPPVSASVHLLLLRVRSGRLAGAVEAFSFGYM